MGISLVVIPAGEIARAQFWRAGTQETYRARVWVPGLASGLARDDKTSFAAHDLVVGGRLPDRESPTTSKESERANKGESRKRPTKCPAVTRETALPFDRL